jgi:hypothetical protein
VSLVSEAEQLANICLSGWPFPLRSCITYLTLATPFYPTSSSKPWYAPLLKMTLAFHIQHLITQICDHLSPLLLSAYPYSSSSCKHALSYARCRHSTYSSRSSKRSSRTLIHLTTLYQQHRLHSCEIWSSTLMGNNPLMKTTVGTFLSQSQFLKHSGF